MTELLIKLSNGVEVPFSCLTSNVEETKKELLNHVYKDGTTVVSVEVM